MASLNCRTLVALDEDAAVLREIEAVASESYNVVAIRNVDRAVSLALVDQSVAAIIVEQALANTSGLAVLKKIQAARPQLRRVLMAGPGHLADIVEGLQCGAICRIVYKPIHPLELSAAISIPDASLKRATA